MKSDLLTRSLGRPNREQVVTMRPTTLTTLQAIDLANGQIIADLLARGGANVLARHDSVDGVVDWIYQYGLSRHATAGERAIAAELLGDVPTQESVEDWLWAVFMLPEFQLIR